MAHTKPMTVEEIAKRIVTPIMETCERCSGFGCSYCEGFGRYEHPRDTKLLYEIQKALLTFAAQEAEPWKARAELAEEQLSTEQKELRQIKAILDAHSVDTNGAEGYGKRQSLTPSQRVEKLVQRATEPLVEALAYIEWNCDSREEEWARRTAAQALTAHRAKYPRKT